MEIAKVFWSDGAQVVRLPPSIKLSGDEVGVRMEGEALILEPVKDEWAWLDDLVPLTPDAVAAALEEPDQHYRPELDKLG